MREVVIAILAGVLIAIVVVSLLVHFPLWPRAASCRPGL